MNKKCHQVSDEPRGWAWTRPQSPLHARSPNNGIHFRLQPGSQALSSLGRFAVNSPHESVLHRKHLNSFPAPPKIMETAEGNRFPDHVIEGLHASMCAFNGVVSTFPRLSPAELLQFTEMFRETISVATEATRNAACERFHKWVRVRAACRLATQAISKDRVPSEYPIPSDDP